MGIVEPTYRIGEKSPTPLYREKIKKRSIFRFSRYLFIVFSNPNNCFYSIAYNSKKFSIHFLKE